MRPVKRCLLVGYNGARNTGSDLRTLQIIDDLRCVLGNETEISVVSVEPGWEEFSTHRPGIRILKARLSLLPLQMVRWVFQHDAVLLVEGSTFKENWSALLLWAFLWSAFVAISTRRWSIAYCVDAGRLRPLHQWFAVWVCNRLSLIIVRTQAAKDLLGSWGVRSQIYVAADPVLRFAVAARGEKTATATPAKRVGVAPIEFFQWPIKVRLFGPSELRYRWPLYFSWDASRAAKSHLVVEAFAALCVQAIDKHDRDVTIIAMEPVDDRICRSIFEALPPSHAARVTLMTRASHTAHELFAELRGLDLLVTARYHAAIIALPAAVPQVAVYHDERLESLFREMQMLDTCAVACEAADLRDELAKRLDWCVEHHTCLHARIQRWYSPGMVDRSAAAREILQKTMASVISC